MRVSSVACSVGRCIAVGVVAGLIGCVGSPPPDHTDELPVQPPTTWTAQTEQAVVAFEPGWLDDIPDPRLRSLVTEAVEHNYDLQAAAQRVEAFRANAVIAGADRLPQISGGLDASRSMRSAEGPGGQVQRDRSNQFGLRLDLSWEVDVWGRLEDQADAAVADLQATYTDYRGARLSIAAQTAQAWFNAIEAQLQVQLAEETVESFEENLEILQQRFARGLSSELDVRLMRQSVASARSDLAFRRRQRDAAVRALEVLLGRYPAKRVALVDDLPTVTEPVPAGLPSELIRRRPDLVAAERDLAAADERVSAAEKNLLPSIRLTGDTGTSSEELAEVLDPDFGLWTVAAGLTQPLFQGGRLLAQVDRTEAQYRELRALYAQTALRAFQEVETALAAARHLAREEEATERSVAEAEAAEDLAWQQIQQGVPGTDIITVLEAQRRLFNAQQQLLSVRNARLQNRIDLYLALGGDFAAPAEEPTAEPGEALPGEPGGEAGAGPDQGQGEAETSSSVG